MDTPNHHQRLRLRETVSNREIQLKVVVAIDSGGVERPQVAPLSRPSGSTCQVEDVHDGGGDLWGDRAMETVVAIWTRKAQRV